MPEEKYETRKFSENEIREAVSTKLQPPHLMEREQDEGMVTETESPKVQEGTGEKELLLTAIQGLLHTLTVKKLEKVLDFIENIEVNQ